MKTELVQIADVLRLLSCPTRQKIIVLMMAKEFRSIPELMRLIGESHAVAFKNIRILMEEGIVIETRAPYGQRKVYKIRESNLGYIAAIYDNARMMNTGDFGTGRRGGSWHMDRLTKSTGGKYRGKRNRRIR